MTTSAMQVEEVLSRLQTALSDVSTVLGLLCGPLDSIGLLPPQFRRYNVEPLTPGAVNISRHIPALQREILRHIGPTWESALAEKDGAPLLDQYFCPDAFSFASTAAGDVTVLAYSTILSLPLTDYSIRLLVKLSERYPIDRLHTAVFFGRAPDAKQSLAWEDCVRNMAAVPAKVANSLQGKTVPPQLEHGFYFSAVCKRCECAIAALPASPREHEVASLTYLLTKLVNLGTFPPALPTSRSQPSFFHACLPQIRVRFTQENAASYSAAWSRILRGFASSFSLQSILTSLFSSLSAGSGIDCSQPQRALVKGESHVLLRLLGSVLSDDAELWESISAVILTREWSEGHARIFVCWISSPRTDEHALELLLDRVVDMWASPDHVKHSLLTRHHYLTTLLLVTLSYFPSSSPKLQSLALSSELISGVGRYISHLDSSIRRCGMLAAEVVAQLSGKQLDFGDWEGDDGGKAWARSVRQLLKARDADASLEDAEAAPAPTDDVEVQEISTPGIRSAAMNIPPTSDVGYDSDDSLSGYISQSSSRSNSPTPSELAEIEKDPTLGVGAKKVPRPVYLAQLGALIRPAGGLKVDENQLANEVEMGINCAEELIRKKKGYGTELEENAVNLVYGLVGLQNNYELEGFSSKRQGALNALVACSPRTAAPCIIEEFFKNQYSTDQRFAMLNSLALGARELASLPVPPSAVLQKRIAFPSKTLPIHLHQKYLKDSDDAQVLPQILDDISREALNRDAESNADKVPELVRERRLRVQKPPAITDVGPHRTLHTPPSQNTTLNQVAAQYFTAPLINRFWLFFRDEQTREQRTAHQDGRQRYQGAGTGLILNPIVLSHFLATLAILVHASKNAPEWLAVIAPDALELAVTLGTRPVSSMESDDEEREGSKSKEAAVLSSALELALVVLDGCLEIDGGHALGLEHTELLLGAGEWANAVFSRLDKGTRIEGGGGMQEAKLKRAAAGVLLKVDSLTSRWRRSMIDAA
ncbi:telomere length regulation protein-domain-containing protein [Mycena metata]|uniref:Telomere length regulation protein-domain-containing protein n=1 Tax=Mycena metata TaxID=1033252 RepID=A0AAD7DJ19_9AGAR|nr:telomere length regulation protein-domain-containing protein [Mycena metata]